ncbi:MAG TPA: hypothetical protein VGH27_28875 [Streptosporangiaceae bacterium]|jgi:hypothetical protein
MDAETHPDPFHDALSHGVQRAVQVASSAVTGAQAYAYLKRAHDRTVAERRGRSRRTTATAPDPDRGAARTQWSPGLDPRWLRRADLISTARVWGAAMPYADRATAWYDPTAEKAMRNCEERLRHLHPAAMTHYDRLRAEGMGPAEAMREAAFLFARPPSAYDSAYAPRPTLNAGSGQDLPWTAAPEPDAPGPDADSLAVADAQERRGRQLIETWQAHASAQGITPPGKAEQRLLLETSTNLPTDVIDRVVQTAPGTGHHDPGHNRASQGTAHPRRTDRPWVHDFPVPIDEVVAAAGRATKTTEPTAALAKQQAHHAGQQP